MNSYDLPDDVFEEGEVRPTKAKKAKSGKASAVNGKKRTVADANLEASGR